MLEKVNLVVLLLILFAIFTYTENFQYKLYFRFEMCCLVILIVSLVVTVYKLLAHPVDHRQIDQLRQQDIR